MAIKTVEIDTVAEFFKKFPEWWVLDQIKPHLKYIADLEEVQNGEALKISFKSEVSWPRIVMCVAGMKADECWQVTGDKTVTLWWD